MASPAQFTANRQNARRSTGPVTATGKQASAANAVKHGLTGKQIVIAGEDAAEFEQLRQGFHDSYKPANDPERALVDQIAANVWRLRRAYKLEAALFDKLAEDSEEDPISAIAAAFMEQPAAIAKMQRYLITAQNAYHKAINELTKLQKDRAKRENDAAMRSLLLATQPPAPQRQAAAIGFVSQPAPACSHSPSISAQFEPARSAHGLYD